MFAASLTTCANDGFGAGLELHASPQKIRLTAVFLSFFPPPSLTVVVAGASPALLNFWTTRSAPPGAGPSTGAADSCCGGDTTPLPSPNVHFRGAFVLAGLVLGSLVAIGVLLAGCGWNYGPTSVRQPTRNEPSFRQYVRIGGAQLAVVRASGPSLEDGRARCFRQG